MRNIFDTMITEYKKIFTDFGAVLILLLAPIFYSFFYPYPYEEELVRKIPTAVIDEDRSDLSQKIVRMLNATENIKAIKFPTMGEAKDAFYEREINAIIHIPKNFYADVVKGQQPIVTLFADGSYMIFYSETLSASMQVVLTAAAGVKVQKMTKMGIPTLAAINLQSAANVARKPLFNAAGGYGAYVVPSVLVLILQQILLVGMFMVQGTESERGYKFKAGIHPIEVLIGKTITYFSFFALNAFFFFTVPMYIFSFPGFGHTFDMVMFLIPYGLSVVFLGLACSYFVREREGGVLFMVMTSIPFLFLSGFAWPIWAMPEWLHYLRLVIPSSSGVYGFTVIRQLGGSLDGVMSSYINLWVLAIIYMALAIFAMRHHIKRADKILS